jgi:hypothetical protein
MDRPVFLNITGNGELGTIELNYAIIGRTGLIVHQKFQSSKKGLENYRIDPTPKMAPSSFVIIYYIQSSGEIIYDQVRLDFETALTNEVSN